MKERIKILETIERAIKLMGEMTSVNCECDKAHEGGYCPLCNRHEKVVSSLQKAHSLIIQEP